VPAKRAERVDCPGNRDTDSMQLVGIDRTPLLASTAVLFKGLDRSSLVVGFAPCLTLSPSDLGMRKA